MSCAQVMYQPYAPNPYVVQTEAQQTAVAAAAAAAAASAGASQHGSGAASSATSAGDSRHSEGGGGSGGGGSGGSGGGPVLHHPQTSTSSIITPHTPPHAHHHHHQPQPPPPPSGPAAQPQPTPLNQPHIQRASEGGQGSAGGQVPQPQASQQSQATSSDGSSGAQQRPLARPPYRAASNGSATADPEAPPPEKKFCSEADAPPAPATPSSSSLPHSHHPHHHQASHPQHHHHHHHHHHSHHHPPHTEPPESPTQHNQQQQQQQQQQQEVKYVSANCMVVTHYAGDASAVVDEHFTRALSTPHYEKPHSPGKAASPMTSRNFPPSFWNSNYQSPTTSSSSSSRPPSLAGHLSGASPAELYDPYHGGLHSLQPPAPDPWAAYSLSSQAYGHRSVAHDVYQAAMSSVPSSSRPYHQYSSLSFQPHLARLPGVTPVASQMPMAKPESWGARYHDAFSNPELAHGLETNYPAAHYPNVPGLETGVPQEGAKDLYWF